MGNPQLRIDDERINMAKALPLLGKSARVAQQMAEAGEIPGAIKIRGEWTFSRAKLTAWLEELENAQCQEREAVVKVGRRAKRPATPNGFGARKKVGSLKAESASADGSSDGRYEQAMSKLLSLGLKKTSHG